MIASRQLHAVTEPPGEPWLFHLMGSDGQHCLLGLVDVGRIRGPHDAVQIEEEDERHPLGALVPVGERVSTADSSIMSG